MKVQLFAIIVLIVVGCKKPEERTCWKFAGDKTSLTIPLGEFDKLFLGAHIKFTLKQDTVNYLEVSGHENLIQLVKADISEGLLRIENKNKCNFLRNYDTKLIEVVIHFKELINLEFQGTEPMNSEGVLNLNYFTFMIKDGAGPVNLAINADVIYASVNHGFGDFTFSGNVNYANFRISSNGYCNTNQLNVNDSIDVIYNSAVESTFNFDNVPARVEILSLGNVRYIGNPTTIDFFDYGEGDLINGN